MRTDEEKKRNLDSVNYFKVCANKPFINPHLDFVSYRPFYKTLELGGIEKGRVLSINAMG